MPTIIVAEAGQNHSGSLENAFRLIDMAHDAGCDYVKFQKRTPEMAVPLDQQAKMRDGTPWGTLTYLEYRRKLEFEGFEFEAIAGYCEEKGIPFFGSCWDIPSAGFLMAYEPDYIKIPSAKLTDDPLLTWLRKNSAKQPNTRIVLSTGMSTLEEIEHAVQTLGPTNPLLMHCTSTYPCPPEEINLLAMATLRATYPYEVGYSGHETSLAPTLAAVAMGATMVERHITLDRSMWGSDQAASVEPAGLKRLVKDIRLIERSMGDGVKKVEPGEVEPRRRLRGDHAASEGTQQQGG